VTTCHSHENSAPWKGFPKGIVLWRGAGGNPQRNTLWAGGWDTNRWSFVLQDVGSNRHGGFRAGKDKMKTMVRPGPTGVRIAHARLA